MAYQNVKVPEGGAKISIKDGKLQVPNNPIIPFVEGDGTGRDIWRALGWSDPDAISTLTAGEFLRCARKRRAVNP